MSRPTAMDVPFPTAATTPLWGVVTAVQANYYWVTLDSSPNRGAWPRSALLCIRRARLKKIGQRVMVGDRVQVVDPDWEGQRGAIAAVAPRQTVLDRPPIANADQVLLLFALAEPELDPHQLNRFLVKAESTGLDVLICLNKQDLVTDQTQHHWRQRLGQWGYDPVLISLRQGQAWADLYPRLQGRITVISGPSGVGKSSLINCLVPEADVRTNAVSGKLGRGRHTTRHVELFPLPQGGLLADTPGFNQPDVTLPPTDLGGCFPEIRQHLAQNACQFKDCLHLDEPGCAVGRHWDRYDFYSEMVAEIAALPSGSMSRVQGQQSMKAKVGDMGHVHQEPMLQAKKYRRVSRRRQRQTLADLHYTTLDPALDLEGLDDESDLGL